MAGSRRRDTPTTRGVRSQKLTVDAKLARTTAGQAYPKAAPSAEAIREFIAAQTCPWCGEGPWKLLARHTNQAHGVSAAEIREMARLTKNAPLCSEEVSRDRSERSKGVRLPDSAYENLRRRRSEGIPAEMSEAGKESNRKKLEAARSPEQARRAAAALAAKVCAENGPKYEEILRLTKQNLTQREIADRVGLNVATVRDVWKRNGVNPDERGSWWKNTTPDIRRSHSDHLQQQRDQHNLRRREESRALVEEFTDLGGNAEAIQMLSERLGVTRKSVVDRLKRHGADVPDLRSAR